MSPTPIVLPSGIELNFVRVGSGPTLIFIHGAMGDFRAWIPQWDAFIQQFDCISYSRRYSYPNSNELNDRSHSALVDAEDLEQLMDSLDIEKAILVGSSYGGFTALATALRIPERIRALVAVEAPMMRYAERNPETAEVVRAFREASADPARVAFEAGDDLTGVMTLTGGIAGQAPDSIPQHVLQRRMENARAARSLAISDDEFPWLEPDDLASLPMPVLLISGNDTAPIHAAIFSEVCKAMPKARVRIVEGSGHSVSQMQPEIFNSEVLEFLKDNNCLS
jgi:pimeloyl-ACP methyl ester carboxylesterase